MPDTQYTQYASNNLPFYPLDGPKRPENKPKDEFYRPEENKQLPIKPYEQIRRRISNPPQERPQRSQ